MNYFKSILNVVKTYSCISVPIYAIDYLGFHHQPFQYFVKFKPIIYQLRNGVRFIVRPFTYNRSIIDEIFILRKYTPKNFGIESGDTVVDLGAHIGIFTVFAANQAKNINLYSYEPIPQNFTLLKENVKLNKIENRVKSFQAAVSSKRGSITLYEHALGSSSTRKQYNKHHGNHIISVNSVTLEDIFITNKIDEIDFLKVDIEGAEFEVFRSLRTENLKKIKKIAMECHLSFGDFCELKRIFRGIQISGYN